MVSLLLLPDTGIIFCMRPAYERRHYNVMSSLIGWAHTQNDPCRYIFSIVIQNCYLDENIGLSIQGIIFLQLKLYFGKLCKSKPLVSIMFPPFHGLRPKWITWVHQQLSKVKFLYHPINVVVNKDWSGCQLCLFSRLEMPRDQKLHQSPFSVYYLKLHFSCVEDFAKPGKQTKRYC